MEQYRTDAEIYAVLEREIIDLTIRPGSLLSENPLCSRFAAPRSMIRVVLQKLQENGKERPGSIVSKEPVIKPFLQP